MIHCKSIFAIRPRINTPRLGRDASPHLLAYDCVWSGEPSPVSHTGSQMHPCRLRDKMMLDDSPAVLLT